MQLLLRKVNNSDLKDSNEIDDTMSSGRQFQSAIILGKYEHNIKTSLFAYDTQNLNNNYLNFAINYY